MVERKCRWCGKPLSDGCHHLTRYCSDECRLAGQKEQKDKYREGSRARASSAAGRYGSLHYRPTGETTENLIEITRSAEQCGMSYGKYVAAMAAKGARK